MFVIVGASGKERIAMKATANAAVAGVLVVLGAGAVIAQSDPIATRKTLMKENNENAKLAVQMMRGQTPFDAAKVDTAFAQWADTRKSYLVFSRTIRRVDRTRAPKIWMTKADFDAKAAEFGKAVAENRDKAKTSVDGLRAAIPQVGNACDNCHKDYRLSRQ